MKAVMAERSPDVKTPHVMVATPGGALGQGGIDRIMTSLRDELRRQDVPASHITFVSTRGNGHIILSPLYVVAFIVRMISARFLGRLDVLHINVASDGSTFRKLIICAFARVIGIPYVIHLHGAEYMRFWSDKASFLNRQIGAMFSHAAAIIVLGRPWRDFVAEKVPAAADRILVIPNATGVPSRPHVGGGESIHILFLGRIGERKGVPQLCDALAAIRDLPGWKATIAGDGDVDWLRSRLAALGLADRVAAPGWQQASDVAALLSQADILALPSFAENLPVSVIEAMAEGIAIIATPVGAVEDIIDDGYTGLLVTPGDVSMLKSALERLVVDADLRRRLGEAARQTHRERLDLPPYARAIMNIWTNAARGCRKDGEIE